MNYLKLLLICFRPAWCMIALKMTYSYLWFIPRLSTTKTRSQTHFDQESKYFHTIYKALTNLIQVNTPTQILSIQLPKGFRFESWYGSFWCHVIRPVSSALKVKEYSPILQENVGKKAKEKCWLFVKLTTSQNTTRLLQKRKIYKHWLLRNSSCFNLQTSKTSKWFPSPEVPKNCFSLYKKQMALSTFFLFDVVALPRV